jgi:hypothetical protein
LRDHVEKAALGPEDLVGMESGALLFFVPVRVEDAVRG